MDMNVAVVHEWLIDWGGSESSLAAILECLPQAELFALFERLPAEHRERLGGREIHTSFLQRAPAISTRFWYYLPLMPLAVEQLDLRGYEVVISSSHAFAKGVLTAADQLHISYVYSPMRYAWDLYHDYMVDYGLSRGPVSWAARLTFHKLRQWDVGTHHGVDRFVAISDFVARRIWKTYRRRAAVIYPPVDVSRFVMSEAKEDFYLVVSRLVSYKKVDLIIEAFAAMPGRRLVVIGDGPEYSRLQARATANVTMLGHQPDTVVAHYMQTARAFLFAAVEDFGIAPVEAQACGTPVIALGRGGALETVRGLDGCDSPTGIFFQTQSTLALQAAIERFEHCAESITAQACRCNAEGFSVERFRREFSEFVEKTLTAWRQSGGRILDDGSPLLQPAPK